MHEVTEQKLKNTIEHDVINGVFPNRNAGVPVELRIQATLNPRNVAEALDCEVILDPGAGRSYIVANENWSNLPLRQMKSALSVQFADGSSQLIKSCLDADLTIYAQNTSEAVEMKNLVFYFIKAPERTLEILMGRDLINLFQIDILAATKAQIGKIILTDNDETEFNEDDWIKDSDKIQLLKSLAQENIDELLMEMGFQPPNDTDTSETENTKLKIMFLPGDPNAPMGRAHIRIPWKGAERPQLNLKRAWTRDRITCNRLSQHEKSLYNDAVKTMVEGKFAEYVEQNDEIGKHYIASTPQIKTDRSTTKCRICLDARSINQFTHKGTILGAPIAECLLKFRKTKFVGIYDLQKAFWQVKLQEDEIGYYNTVIDGNKLRFNSMIFGANWSPSGLETALQTILEWAADRISSNSPLAIGEPKRPLRIRESHYVDDFSHGSEDPDSLIIDCQWTRWFLNQYGFSSDKFATNTTTDKSTEEHKHLGYFWDPSLDTIRVKPIEPLDIPQNPTVRTIIQHIAKFFDPLGLDLKKQLLGRLVIRDAFQHRKTSGAKPWNNEVQLETVELLKQWQSTLTDLPPPCPRHIEPNRLNVFCDGSLDAWAVEVRDANYSLIFAKGGLPPPKATVPVIELIGLYNAVMTTAEILRIFDSTEEVVIYCDNECTVYRLKRPKASLSKFEMNRISKMRAVLADLKKKIEITHIPGDLNYADYPSRPRQKTGRPTIDTGLIEAYRRDPGTTKSSWPGASIDEIDADLDEWLTTEPSDRLAKMVLRSSKRKISMPEEIENVVLNEEDSAEPKPAEEDLEINDNEQDTVKSRVEKVLESQKQHLTQLLEDIENGSVRDKKHRYRIDNQGVIRRDDKAVIPDTDEELRNELVRRFHMKDHSGVKSTHHRLMHHYYWKNMRKDVQKFCKDCTTCQLVKTHHEIRATAGEAIRIKDLDSIPIGAIVGIDVVVIEAVQEEVPSAVITITCLVSKWIRAVPIRNQLSGEIIQALESVFNSSIWPTVLVMDNAPQFRSKLFARFCVRHDIRRCHPPAYASPYNGWIERSHKGILAGLRALVVGDSTIHWTHHLPEACYLLNSRPYEDDDPTGLSPIHLIYSGQQLLRDDLSKMISEELLEKAGIAHMAVVDRDELRAYAEKASGKHKRFMQRYEAIHNAKRLQIRERLRRNLTDKSHSCPVGSWVRVFRPLRTKVSIKWSEPRKVVEAPTPSTRVVERGDGNRSLEWIANLMATDAPDGSSPAGNVLT